jgi:D-lactate dehydrogenase
LTLGGRWEIFYTAMVDGCKIVFFDVDRITGSYLQGRPMGGAGVELVERSIDQLTAAELRPYAQAEVVSVFVHSARVGAAVLDNFPRLRLIAVRSTGYDNIDLDHCRARGIAVANAPRYGAITVAEYAFSLLLSLSRRVFPAMRDLVAGEVCLEEYIGFDLFGRTLGVVGTGAIGLHAIKIAKGFGMNVVACDPYPNAKAAEELAFSYLSPAELWHVSDAISLHAPLTRDNHHMLNAAAFAAMRQGVVIVNTARGELIDTGALVDALGSGKVAAAGLDVLEEENFLIQNGKNLPDQGHDAMVKSFHNMRMMRMPNVILTPHIAFNSRDAVHRILHMTVENIEDFLAMARPRYPVI